MRRSLWLSPLVVLLAGCPPIDLGADGGDTFVVGAAGGIFVRNGAMLDFPHGAVTEDTRITVTITDTGVPDVPQRKRVSFGYRLSPNNIKFASPFKITLPVLPDRVPQAVDPATFDSRRNLGSEAYAQLPAARTVTWDNPPVTAVEAQTDKLGLFWITSPSQANVARLELDPTTATLMVGGTQQFTARVVDPTGGTIDATVTWSVAPPRVAAIDAKGLLTAKDPGTATVTARAGSQSATAEVFVVGTTRGPSSFVHDNPFPTGNDLWGGALAPGGLGVVFAGANGTVLARGAGNLWTRLFSVPGVVLKGVAGTTADNAVAVGTTSGAGVLVEFKGLTAAPAVKVFDPSRELSELTAVWFDGTFGMAVGAGNDVLIRRNGAWGTEYSPSFENLLAVVGDGAGGFVTVGDLGSIYRWDPARSVWDSLYDTRLSVLLTAAAFNGPTGQDVWAVGGNKLWHFSGGGWTPQNLPAAPAFATNGATALGLVDGRLVVAGTSTAQAGLILAIQLSPQAPDAGAGDAGVDGGQPAGFAAFPMRGPQVARAVFGGGVASQAGFVVGDYGAIWEWNAASAAFVEVSHGFYGDVSDVAVVSGDVFAGVNECTAPGCATRRGEVLHQADGGWARLGDPQPFSGRVLAVAAKSQTELVIATSSELFHWDGAAWSPVGVQGGLSGAVNDLRYCGATLWGAGDNGTVYRGSSAAMSNAGSILAQGNLTAVHCPSENEVWVAGDYFLASRINGSAWTPRSAQNVQNSAWRAVWSPGGGEAFAFGDDTYGVYWDTTDLKALNALGGVVPFSVSALWGSSIDNLYAVGLAQLPAKFGFALRFDGVTWRLVDSGSQRKVTAIDGSSATNVWVGTEGGGLLRAVPLQ